MFRRFLLGILLVIIKDTDNPVYLPYIFPAIILIIASMLQLCYVLSHRPFIEKGLNRLDLFNEMMVYLFSITYLIILGAPENPNEVSDEATEL